MDKIREILKRLADCLNKHWVWKTVILFMPLIYFPIIIEYASFKDIIIDNNKKLTKVGLIVTGLIYISVLVVNILSSYKSKQDKLNNAIIEKKYLCQIENYKKEIQEYDSTLNVYKQLLSCLGDICDQKLNGICVYIENSLKRGVFSRIFNETVCPEKQLKSIAKEIKKCLSEITMPPVDNITVSMAYNFPVLGTKMKWIDQQETALCLQLKQLTTNISTTFYKIYSGESQYLFYNDKIAASIDNNYLFDKKDHKFNNVGSIICEEIAIENDEEKIARIILTISAYGYKFSDSTDMDILNKITNIIKELILQQFETRIKIELGYLFIKEKFNNKI